MGKSRNKSRSEVESLRGQVRQLRAQLKYYKRRTQDHEDFVDDLTEDEELSNIDVSKCPVCTKGALIEFDFNYVLVKKCTDCDYKTTQKKKPQKDQV